MELQRRDDVAILELRGGKANAMDTGFLDRLAGLVDAAEASGARAVVITGHAGVFSAGLALPSLWDLDRDAMRSFIDGFARAMLRVLRCDLPVVAAVNGHAIAGGCVLALQADVRLMARGAAKIGLNEAQLGIGLPAVVVEVLRQRVPPPALVPIAVEGRLLLPDEALALGLVDELVDAADLRERAVARARALAEVPAAGVAQIKAALRRPALEAIGRHDVAEREAWLDTWFSPAARARIGAVVAKLAGR